MEKIKIFKKEVFDAIEETIYFYHDYEIKKKATELTQDAYFKCSQVYNPINDILCEK